MKARYGAAAFFSATIPYWIYPKQYIFDTDTPNFIGRPPARGPRRGHVYEQRSIGARNDAVSSSAGSHRAALVRYADVDTSFLIWMFFSFVNPVLATHNREEQGVEKGCEKKSPKKVLDSQLFS